MPRDRPARGALVSARSARRARPAPPVRSYRAFGLTVRSTLPMPELPPGAGAGGEILVHQGRVRDTPGTARARGPSARRGPDELVLAWPEVGAIAVRRGAEIVVDAAPRADARLVRLHVLGPGLGLLLHQRGLLVLHASAVALGDGAVAFLGHPGAGKSTVAAALHARGCRLVADDVLALDPRAAGGPLAYPGIPQLRLWPDVLASLGEAAEPLPRVHPPFDKRARAVPTDAFAPAPLPLRRLYVLADGDRLAIEPLDTQARLMAVLRHAYGARLLQALAPAAHLRRCAAVVSGVPVRRLRRPRVLDGLAALVEAVEQDAATPPAGAGS